MPCHLVFQSFAISSVVYEIERRSGRGVFVEHLEDPGSLSTIQLLTSFLFEERSKFLELSRSAYDDNRRLGRVRAYTHHVEVEVDRSGVVAEYSTVIFLGTRTQNPHCLPVHGFFEAYYTRAFSCTACQYGTSVAVQSCVMDKVKVSQQPIASTLSFSTDLSRNDHTRPAEYRTRLSGGVETLRCLVSIVRRPYHERKNADWSPNGEPSGSRFAGLLKSNPRWTRIEALSGLSNGSTQAYPDEDVENALDNCSASDVHESLGLLGPLGPHAASSQ